MKELGILIYPGGSAAEILLVNGLIFFVKKKNCLYTLLSGKLIELQK